MKRLSLVLLVVVFFAACKKNESERPNPIDPVVPTLLGQWKEVQYYVSPGSLASWTDVPDGGKVMINPNGEYKTSKPVTFFGTGGTIVLKSDSTFTMSNSSAMGSYFFKFTDNGNTVTIWFSACIEGCGVKLKRVAFPG